MTNLRRTTRTQYIESVMLAKPDGRLPGAAEDVHIPRGPQMKTILLLCVLAAFLAGGLSPASAQKFFNYACADGSQLVAAFVPQSKSAYVQLDGKAMTLPQRLAASGARYAKSGVTFWIKGNSARLKRPKKKWTQCSTVS
jgi:membrane-bound inhibitor of C-type lysozyme